MKRAFIYSLFTAASFATGYAGTSSVASQHSIVTRVAEDRIPCITENGKSGYMVSSGDVMVCKEIGDA